MIRVSVVIPTYNRRKALLRAIESIRAQSIQVHEIIVVDDGSTDDTADYLAAAVSPVVYLRTKNRGVSSARNIGIHKASCEWVAFLDSDDTWAPDKLERQQALITNTGCVLCFTGCSNEDGERLDDLPLMTSEGANEDFQAPKCDVAFFRHPRHPFVQSALVRRDALISAGLFDESLRVAEDTKLLYRLVMDHGFAAVIAPLVTICRGRSIPGLSDEMDPLLAARRFECYTRVQAEFYWALIGRNTTAAEILRRNHGYFVSRWAELAAVNGDHQLARSLGREASLGRGGFKSRLRGLLTLLSPRLIRGYTRRKWK